jgi:circadian clock protein KaiB
VSGPDNAVPPPDPGHLPATGDGAALPPAAERYVLRLYVTGMTTRSAAAIRNLQAICDERLAGRYDLEVIDIYQQPVLTKGEQIIAAPTLIKKLPLPMRRLVGDMSDRERVLWGLDLVNQSDPTK